MTKNILYWCILLAFLWSSSCISMTQSLGLLYTYNNKTRARQKANIRLCLPFQWECNERTSTERKAMRMEKTEFQNGQDRTEATKRRGVEKRKFFGARGKHSCVRMPAWNSTFFVITLLLCAVYLLVILFCLVVCPYKSDRTDVIVEVTEELVATNFVGAKADEIYVFG